VAEWLNAAVLKTVRPERVSGVRIPPPPPLSECGCLRRATTFLPTHLFETGARDQRELFVPTRVEVDYYFPDYASYHSPTLFVALLSYVASASKEVRFDSLAA
jgi:hypothetical protein